MASGKKNYFRHNFNAHEDPKIVRLMNKHGLAGYAMFFILIELYARQCENEFKESVTINKRTLRQSWRKVGPTCDQGLADLQSMLLLRYTLDEESYNIEIPNIVKYLGKYESKLHPNAPNKRKEKESKRKESKVNKTITPPDDFKNIEYKYLGAMQDNKTARLAMEYLNQVSGKKYKTKSQYTDEMIDKLVEEGYTTDDIKKVIDIKSQQWKGTDMEKFLRPKTLFTIENFSGYLNEEERKPFVYDVDAQIAALEEAKELDRQSK